MINVNDFKMKQIVFVFANDGDKIAFLNENLVVSESVHDADDNNNEAEKKVKSRIKFQVSLYRLFLIYIVGDLSITTAILKKAREYGFFIALLSTGFKLYDVLGAKKDGNTLLIDKQFSYNGLDIGKYIIKNKIQNQGLVLRSIRNKNSELKATISALDDNCNNVADCDEFYNLLAIEGNSAKIYFKELYKDLDWHSRRPRIKSDIINSTLDIGYTVLFSFIEAIVSAFGFNLFRGVLHKQFYMRKSLICDLMEPFRPIIDYQVRKSFNLGEIKEKDFLNINHQYKLKWQESKRVVNFLLEPLVAQKEEIFRYIQSYYRYFMKSDYSRPMPEFKWRIYNGNN